LRLTGHIYFFIFLFNFRCLFLSCCYIYWKYIFEICFMVWSACRLENTLNYGLERVWAVGYLKGSRRWAFSRINILQFLNNFFYALEQCEWETAVANCACIMKSPCIYSFFITKIVGCVQTELWLAMMKEQLWSNLVERYLWLAWTTAGKLFGLSIMKFRLSISKV